MIPHIEEIGTGIPHTPHRRYACAATFPLLGRSVDVLTCDALHPADLFEEMT